MESGNGYWNVFGVIFLVCRSLPIGQTVLKNDNFQISGSYSNVDRCSRVELNQIQSFLKILRVQKARQSFFELWSVMKMRHDFSDFTIFVTKKCVISINRKQPQSNCHNLEQSLNVNFINRYPAYWFSYQDRSPLIQKHSNENLKCINWKHISFTFNL